jgi:hypothetical protein
VKAGGTLTNAGGLLAIDAVEIIDPADVDDGAARAAGYQDRHELFANIRGDAPLYRIRFHRLGEDPRIALRVETALTPVEVARIERFLDRNDWALGYLRLIGEMPAVVSTVLAAKVGEERLYFKQRVRRLKALGLTESLDIGYRLSPRGRAVLESAIGPAGTG